MFSFLHLSLLGLACLLATLVSYGVSKRLYRHFGYWYLSPMLLTPAILLALVGFFAIPLPTYFEYNHYLSMLLAPATIAFALPIYRERRLIRRYPLTLGLGVLTGLLVGLLSSWLLSQVIYLPPELSHSLLVRSVSTPFALEATTEFGGVPDLTAVLVLMTGVLGMVLCGPVFKLARISSPLAKGAALGASAHGVGAAKAAEYGREEGVVASLTMIFTGIAMVVGAPLFAYLLV
ncbi:LrgB family protein [Shewanella marisflavi]|uniref:Murein hydrolase effector protein LrgB n=1 Tax=Shewanella marisflavi TaxID=260364 RepID=A0AAC9U1D7_9GAMM|nr:LrgB family protein [Shewanella marisflavi]ASJ97856.1 murein hydrolase effector protein LrgB [Shewanella marisflavi]